MIVREEEPNNFPAQDVIDVLHNVGRFPVGSTGALCRQKVAVSAPPDWDGGVHKSVAFHSDAVHLEHLRHQVCSREGDDRVVKQDFRGFSK